MFILGWWCRSSVSASIWPLANCIQIGQGLEVQRICRITRHSAPMTHLYVNIFTCRYTYMYIYIYVYVNVHATTNLCMYVWVCYGYVALIYLHSCIDKVAACTCGCCQSLGILSILISSYAFRIVEYCPLIFNRCAPWRVRHSIGCLHVRVDTLTLVYFWRVGFSRFGGTFSCTCVYVRVFRISTIGCTLMSSQKRKRRRRSPWDLWDYVVGSSPQMRIERNSLKTQCV